MTDGLSGFCYFDILSSVNAWVIADTHLYHKNMVKKYNRPGGYEDIFWQSWKRKVKYRDYVFILGDYCFVKPSKCYVGDLPGVKVLVRGNHDGIKKGRIFKYGFDVICDAALVRVHLKPGDARWVLLTHKRFTNWSVLPKKIVANIHGHSHTKRPLYSSGGRFINVSAEHLLYEFAEIRDLIMMRYNPKVFKSV